MKRHGHARVSAFAPEASGVCDRCGFRYTRSDLTWQQDWAGPKLVNKRWLVCRRCLDEPSNAYRTIILKPDPIPVKDPRSVSWGAQEATLRITESGLVRITEDGRFLSLEGAGNTSEWINRGTEDGSARITEAGDIRIIEQPYVAPI